MKLTQVGVSTVIVGATDCCLNNDRTDTHLSEFDVVYERNTSVNE